MTNRTNAAAVANHELQTYTITTPDGIRRTVGTRAQAIATAIAWKASEIVGPSGLPIYGVLPFDFVPAGACRPFAGARVERLADGAGGRIDSASASSIVVSLTGLGSAVCSPAEFDREFAIVARF